MINLDKLNFFIEKGQAEINPIYFDKTEFAKGNITYNLNSDIAKQSVGINKITDNELGTYISVSGKIMADKGYLGYINKDNYDTLFDRLNQSELLRINRIPSKNIQVLTCDITKDIYVENIAKSIFGIQEYLKRYSNKLKVYSYDYSGIIIKTYAKRVNDSLTIYDKFKELNDHNNRNYLEIIGYKTLDSCQNLLRIERHLSSFDAIRKALNIQHKGNVYLDEVLESNANPIKDKFDSLGLREGDIK